MPLGVLREPGAAGARVALWRATRLAARHDRSARRAELRPLRAGARRTTVRDLPRPVRDAVRAHAQGTSCGHGPRLPRGCRRSAPATWERVARLASAPAGELHDDASARRRRADPRRAL